MAQSLGRRLPDGDRDAEGNRNTLITYSNDFVAQKINQQENVVRELDSSRIGYLLRESLYDPPPDIGD